MLSSVGFTLAAVIIGLLNYLLVKQRGMAKATTAKNLNAKADDGVKIIQIDTVDEKNETRRQSNIIEQLSSLNTTPNVTQHELDEISD